MTGVLIKLWDLSVSDREISLLIPLETSIEETVQEIVSGGGLPALVDGESVEHAREVMERILAGSYNYTWDTDLGQRIRSDFSCTVTGTVDDTASADTIVSDDTTLLVDTTAEENITAANDVIPAAANITDDDNIPADNIIKADFYFTAKDDSPDDLITIVKNETEDFLKIESYPSTDIRETSPNNRMKNTLPYCEVLLEDIMKKKILISPHDEKTPYEILPLSSSDECGKEYKRKSRLKSHISSHTGERPHSCDDCGKTFKQEAALTSHALCFHSESNTFQCDINCSEQFESEYLLKQHQKETHSEYYCDTCSKAYLADHSCDVHTCDVCRKVFYWSEGLKLHMIICHAVEKPHVCDICGQKFALMGLLTCHNKTVHSSDVQLMKNHTEENKHMCHICGCNFSKMQSLISHVFLFHSFYCDINCSKEFESRKLLREHQQEKHPDYYCSVCSKASLKDHVCTKTVKKHSCDSCGKSYTQRSSLKYHIHTAHIGFACNINCSEEFKSTKLLKEHQKERHPEYYCSFCSKAYLTSHICKKNEEKPHACDLCGTKFVEINNLYRHLKKCHPGVKFPCTINCTEVFESMKLLREHQRVNHPENFCDRCSKAFLTNHTCDLHKCYLCGKVFKGLQSMEQHMESHNVGDNQHVCPICGKTYALDKITDHIRNTHNSLRANRQNLTNDDQTVKYACNIDCPKWFKTKVLLRKHQRRAHKESYCNVCHEAFLSPHTCNLLQCEVCGKSFTTRSILKTHMLTHSEERPYRCDKCGKSFAQKFGLNLHISSFHLDISYPCDKCDAKFKQQIYLKYHQKFVHAGIVENVCDFCSKKFISRGQLNNHRRKIHGQGRRFICPVCKKDFSFQSILNDHMLCHGEKRTQACEICNSSFYTRAALTKHKRVVHRKKEFKCDICHKEFYANNSLSAHKLTHKED